MSKPRRSSVVLYHGDDLERIAELRRAAERADRLAEAEAGSARAGDDSSSAEAWQEYREFVEQASERADVWVVEAIGHEEFTDLLEAHPPRGEGDDANPEDAQFGVNTKTFPRALLTFVDPEDDEIRTIAEPALEPTELRRRLKRLSVGEFDTLWVRAFMLNTSGVADPKGDPSWAGSPSANVT